MWTDGLLFPEESKNSLCHCSIPVPLVWNQIWNYPGDAIFHISNIMHYLYIKKDALIDINENKKSACFCMLIQSICQVLAYISLMSTTLWMKLFRSVLSRTKKPMFLLQLSSKGGEFKDHFTFLFSFFCDWRRSNQWLQQEPTGIWPIMIHYCKISSTLSQSQGPGTLLYAARWLMHLIKLSGNH